VTKHTTSVNGAPKNAFPLGDRGLAYGDGLFETMRCIGSTIPLLDYHLDRLRSGCQVLKIPYPEDQVTSGISALMAKTNSASDAILKLILTRGEGGRGYCPPDIGKTEPTLLLNYWETGSDQDTGQNGVEILVLKHRLSSCQRLAGVKHLNRLEYVLAAQEIPFESDIQGLLLNEDEKVVETLHHNIFCVRSGVLFTPSLDNSGVSGVMRRFLMEKLIVSANISCVVKELSLEELVSSDEVFICNSVRGIWPVRKCGPVQWVDWPFAQKFQELVKDLWRSHGC